MYTLNVETRDPKLKAKKIRKNGMIPCNISDGKMKETILISISDGEVKKLLREKGKGGKVLLCCEDGRKYNAIIKEIVYIPLNNQIETITFQLLNEEEYVNSFARVILKNKDKVQAMVHLPVTEILYKSLPQDLVEEVEIDLAKLKTGSSVLLRDLSIWKNEKLSIDMKEETTIVSISQK